MYLFSSNGHNTGCRHSGFGVGYPDGLVVAWQRDTAGNVTAVTATRNSVTRTLANNIVHLPFGPIDDMTLGNSSSVDRSFDQQYLMTDTLTTGIQDLDYAHDLLGNVTGIDNNLDVTRDLTFGYDDLYRITSATGVYGSIGFSFDDVGNWQSRTEGGATETYTYTVDTNRLDLITNAGTVDIVTDAAGNTTGYGSKTLIYNQSNRLVEIEDNSVTLAEYIYSADGRRMKKTVSSQITIYHYDIAGRLIAESDGLGNFNRLYVYVDSEPLAQITLNGASENTYYYHNDHLGTPQKMTDSSGIVVWAADYKPFGEVNITVNTVQNNLRFAGQYFDAESGLHYNYHRYYDPSTGRYLTPDPIGLAGGINLFAYTSNNPVNLIDPYGLASQIPLNAIKMALRKVHKKLGGSLPKGKPGKQGQPQRGDTKKGYRLDKEWHPKSSNPNEQGPHINYWDYTKGKRGKGGISDAEPIVWGVVGFIGSLLDPFGAETLAIPEEDADGNGIPDFLENRSSWDNRCQ